MTTPGGLLCAAALLLSADTQSIPAGQEEQVALRDAAREALRPSCGRCHDSTLPTGRPAALRIFDLAESDWSAHVTLAQMDHMVARFESFKMPEADRIPVQRFLDAERARRTARPAAASDVAAGH
ncbi:MAG: hypothetical protein ACXWLS_07670 [Myxococcaceae bacterium]